MQTPLPDPSRPDEPGSPPNENGPLPWPLLASEAGPDLTVARVRFDTVESPRTKKSMKRLVLETPNWVNVVALTPERQLVLVRQYRFGTSSVTVEIPGGVIDPGEEPLAAAQRELREETGYTSERWSLLATVEPNPAFLDNLCHHYLAEDARATAAVELDPGEDIVVETIPLDEAGRMIAAGEMRHSLVVSALCRVIDLRASDGRGAGRGFHDEPRHRR